MAETSHVWPLKSVKSGLWHSSRHRYFHITTDNLFTSRNMHRYTGNSSADTTTPLQVSIGRNIPNSIKWRLSLTFEVIYCLLQFQTWSKWKQRLIMTLFWPRYVTWEGAPPSHWESWWRSCRNQWRSFHPLNYTLRQTQRPLSDRSALHSGVNIPGLAAKGSYFLLMLYWNLFLVVVDVFLTSVIF